MAGQRLDDSRADDGPRAPDAGAPGVPVMPPVRQLPDEQLAGQARDSLILDTALRLARWVAPSRPVDANGVLELDDAVTAVRELDLLPHLPVGEQKDLLAELGSAEELAELDLPWAIAEELALIEIDEAGARPGRGLAEAEQAERAEPGKLLDLWWEAAEMVVADASVPPVEALLADGDAADAAADEELDLTAEAELLNGALENLYLITALGAGEDPEQAVPLPVLAASMVVPDDMDAPTDEALEEVSSLMMQLDPALQLVASTGMLDYRPLDPALIEEEDEDGEFEEPDDHGDVTRYGLVRLTPLGVYGVRRRLLTTGVTAPVIGELAGAEAGALLDAMARYPDDAAHEEARAWLVVREPLAAARELLAAARGDDPQAPLRRLFCQQALALLGPESDPALYEVLDDRHLGGLARVRLVERGAGDVPDPDEDMVFWLTVDTLAAQLAGGEEEPLQELMRDIPVVQDEPDSFFSSAWRVDHPATAEVLEAVGRLHPDKAVAKEARKAAFKARSRGDA